MKKSRFWSCRQLRLAQSPSGPERFTVALWSRVPDRFNTVRLGYRDWGFRVNHYVFLGKMRLPRFRVVRRESQFQSSPRREDTSFGFILWLVRNTLAWDYAVICAWPTAGRRVVSQSDLVIGQQLPPGMVLYPHTQNACLSAIDANLRYLVV